MRKSYEEVERFLSDINS